MILYPGISLDGEHAIMTKAVKSKKWKAALRFEQGCDLEEGFNRISALLKEMDSFLATVPGIGAEGMADLRLVCDEIGSNVVRHSSPLMDISLDVELEAYSDHVHMRITDTGNEFNPFNQPLPYLGADLEKRRVGGLGLYLINQLFPLANYRRNCGHNISEVEYHMGFDGKKRMMRRSDTVTLKKQL